MAKQLQEPKMLKCQISRTNAISVKKMCYCLFVENIGIIRWTNANQMERMWLNGIPSRWNFFWQFLAQKQIDLHLNNNPWVFLAICKFKICLETKNMIAENTARKYYRIFLVKGKVARIHYVLCVILHLLAERTRLEKCTAFAVASLYYIPLEISPTGHCG